MNNNLKMFLSFIVGGFLLGCATTSGGNYRAVSSSLDTGTIGPDGAVYYASVVYNADYEKYYKPSFGDLIEISRCPNNTVLANNQADIKKQCQDGYVVTEAFFKDTADTIIKSFRYVSDTTKDLVLSRSEMDNYYIAEGIFSLTKSRLEELNQIKAFISAYGTANANKARLAELEKNLTPEKIKAYDIANKEVSQQLLTVTELINKIKSRDINLIMSSQYGNFSKILFDITNNYNCRYRDIFEMKSSVYPPINKGCYYSATISNAKFAK